MARRSTASRAPVRRPAARRRNPNTFYEDVYVLERIGFMSLAPGDSPQQRGALVTSMVRAITTHTGIVKGRFIVNSLERTESAYDIEEGTGLSGLRVKLDARGGRTITYDGHVCVDYRGTGRLTKNILTVPGWVMYNAVDDFGEWQKKGERDPRLVGLPVDRLSWDFDLSDFGVVVQKRYSLAEIERAVGSVDEFDDALGTLGAEWSS